mgnify:CR=1 FL=1
MEWSTRFLEGTSRKLGDCCRLAGVANGYWLLFAAGAPLGLSAAGVALLAEQYWLGPVALAAAGIGWGLFRHALRGEGG